MANGKGRIIAAGLGAVAVTRTAEKSNPAERYMVQVKSNPKSKEVKKS